MTDRTGILDALDAAEVLTVDGAAVCDDASIVVRGRGGGDAGVGESSDRGGEAPTADEAPPWEPSGFSGAPEPPTDTGGVFEIGDLDMATVEKCAGYDHSDTDNAKRLIAHFARDLRVRQQEGGRATLWCTWTGKHWDDVSGGPLAQAVAQRIGDLIKLESTFLVATPSEAAAIAAGRAAEAAVAPGEEPTKAAETVIAAGKAAAAAIENRRGNRVKFGVSSKNKSRVSAMLDMAAPHLITSPDDFNADPLVVGLEDATLRFVRDVTDGCSDPIWQMVADPGHRRDDLITRIVPTRWKPSSSGKRFAAFLRRFMPDDDVRRFLQVVTGLGLVGLTEQILVFHYGTGANGKSVFLEVVSRVLGRLAAGLPAEAISGDDKGGGGLRASPEIARLYGVPFVRIAEIPAGAALKEEFVKRITGGERFPARNLFEGYFEFTPRFTAHASGNGYPRIVGTDNGIWRRMRVIHWPVQLSEGEMRNFEDVVAELCEEREAILAWMAEGVRIYLEEGLVTPAGVLAQTADMREVNDPVRRFFVAALDQTGSDIDRVSGKALYEAYVEWSGGGHTPVNTTRFGLNMTKIFEERAADGLRKDDGGRVVQYVGVRLKPRPATPLGDDPVWSPHQ